MSKYAFVLLGMLLAGCSGMRHPALASGDEPYATVEIMTAADVTETMFPAILEKIDGAQLVQGRRRAFEVTPGEHEFSISIDVMALARYASHRGYQTSMLHAGVRERQVKVALEPGKRYKFGADIPERNFDGWQPFVITVEELETLQQ